VVGAAVVRLAPEVWQIPVGDLIIPVGDRWSL